MKNQNKLAKQIINQATKTKQVLLSTSIKLLTLISVLTLNNYLCAMVPGNTDQAKSDRMAKLAKRAEDMYAASSVEKAADKVSTPVVTPAPKAATIETAKLESDKSEPEALDRTNLDNSLDKHGNIPDDFWKELSQCKKCPPPKKRIDCKKILRDNPDWQKVVPMDRENKKMIMNKALNDLQKKSRDAYRFVEESDDDVCNVICAVCADADPNQLTDGSADTSIITPLRLAHWKSHFGLFRLLLEKGANPSDRGHYSESMHPCNFNYDPPIYNWLDELTKHGEKCPGARDRLRDRR